MKRDDVVAKAKDFLVPTSLLSDIVGADEGPVIARAEGSFSYDTGEPATSISSGQICSALGHSNPRIQKVIEAQAGSSPTRAPFTTMCPGGRRAARLDQRRVAAKIRVWRVGIHSTSLPSCWRAGLPVALPSARLPSFQPQRRSAVSYAAAGPGWPPAQVCIRHPTATGAPTRARARVAAWRHFGMERWTASRAESPRTSSSNRSSAPAVSSSYRSSICRACARSSISAARC